MKRRLLKLGVFLLLGAIINVAVAWGCILWLPHSRANDSWQFFQKVGPPNVPSDWHSFSNEWMSARRRTFGVESKQFLRTGMKSGKYANFSVLLVRVGWPLLCLRCDGHSDTNTILNNFKRDFVWDFAACPPAWLHSRNIDCDHAMATYRPPIPFELMWPGFAINTVFYAALLWVLFYGPGKIRRFIRVRRGRCPACGYKIDSAPGIGPRCSECGHPLPWKT